MLSAGCASLSVVILLSGVVACRATSTAPLAPAASFLRAVVRMYFCCLLFVVVVVDTPYQCSQQVIQGKEESAGRRHRVRLESHHVLSDQIIQKPHAWKVMNALRYFIVLVFALAFAFAFFFFFQLVLFL